jgi:hypothetical protein
MSNMFKFYYLHVLLLIRSIHLVIKINMQCISLNLIPNPVVSVAYAIMSVMSVSTFVINPEQVQTDTLNHIPYSEWIELPEEQWNKILAKRKQE